MKSSLRFLVALLVAAFAVAWFVSSQSSSPSPSQSTDKLLSLAVPDLGSGDSCPESSAAPSRLFPWMLEGFGFGVGGGDQCDASRSDPTPVIMGRFRAATLLGVYVEDFLHHPRLSPTESSYRLTRIVFLRALSFVYFVAFLVAYHQNKALIGDGGITPCRRILWDAELRGRKKAKERREWIVRRRGFRNPAGGYAGLWSIWGKVRWSKWGRAAVDSIEGNDRVDRVREVLWDRSDRLDRPLISVMWLARDRRKLDPWLDGVAVSGMAMAAAMFFLGAANVPLLFGLWLCQRSLMSVGGVWYGYGWEPQLAELGFHALFLVPSLSLHPVAPSMSPPLVAIYAVRWYLFRIMMGAGLIKLKSRDPKWKYPLLDAMHVFYETQPVPNPLSRYFHAMPGWWHKFEVLVNHFVELVAPWLLILPGLPRRWRLAGGLLQIGFQGVLILSGNLSFLNWLTAAPAILCLDDAFVSPLFSPRRVAQAARGTNHPETLLQLFLGRTPTRQAITLAFALLVAALSVPVVRNLLAKRQAMNASFDKLRLINTYGAFGSVSEHRDELVVESAMRSIEGPWREYRFKVKPGDVYRRPRWISPYHHRLDWQIWIAAQGRDILRSPWLLKLMLKLLRGDEGVMGLLEGNPWADEAASAATTEGGPSEEREEGSEGAAAEEVESTDEVGPADDEKGGNGTGKGNAVVGGRPRFIRIVRYRYKFNYDWEEEGGGGGRRRPYWKRERIGKFFPKEGTALTEGMLAEYIS